MWWVCSSGIQPPSQTSQELSSTSAKGNILGSIPSSAETGPKLFCLLTEDPLPPFTGGAEQPLLHRPLQAAFPMYQELLREAWQSSLGSPKAALNVSQLFIHTPHTCCLGSVQLKLILHCKSYSKSVLLSAHVRS